MPTLAWAWHPQSRVHFIWRTNHMRSMRHNLLVGTIIGLLAIPVVGALLAADAADNAGQINTLGDEQKKAGWKLLFNGKDLEGWHNFKHEGVRPGWQVKDGVLTCVDPHNAGDILTK